MRSPGAHPAQAVLLEASGAVVCDWCTIAETPLARMRGLLGRKSLGEREGLLLRPARSVHTFFMRFPIDAVFLDESMTVVRVAQLAPWRFAGSRRARSVLELPVGTASSRGIHIGGVLILQKRPV